MWDKYLRRIVLVSIYNYLYNQSNNLDTTVCVNYTVDSQWLELMLSAADCQQIEYDQVKSQFDKAWQDFLIYKDQFHNIIEPKLNDQQKTYILLRSIFYTFLLEKQDLKLSTEKELKSLINIYLKLLQQFGTNENRQFAHAILTKLDPATENLGQKKDIDKDKEKPIDTINQI
jgi:hypothetical protein